MAHSLTPFPAATATPISASTPSKKKTTHLPFQAFQRVSASQDQAIDHIFLSRRTFGLGLAGAVLGLKAGNQSASAAARRPPPPPPPEERKDPSVSGVQAKVLASKKRKEAMKQSMAKLREKGKPIVEPSE